MKLSYSFRSLRYKLHVQTKSLFFAFALTTICSCPLTRVSDKSAALACHPQVRSLSGEIINTDIESINVLFSLPGKGIFSLRGIEYNNLEIYNQLSPSQNDMGAHWCKITTTADYQFSLVES